MKLFKKYIVIAIVTLTPLLIGCGNYENYIPIDDRDKLMLIILLGA